MQLQEAIQPPTILIISAGLTLKKLNAHCEENVRTMALFAAQSLNSKLSPAEERVMNLIYQGFTKEEVGDKLCLSPNTIKQHVRSAYCKLRVHDKGEFIKLAKDNGFF